MNEPLSSFDALRRASIPFVRRFGGPICAAVPISRSGRAVLFRTEQRNFVVKRMPRDQVPEIFESLWRELLPLIRGHGPDLLGWQRVGEEWIALFSFVAASPLHLVDPRLSDAEVVEGLIHIRRILEGCGPSCPRAARTDHRWLSRLVSLVSRGGAGARLLAWLEVQEPIGLPSFVHGDLLPQNLVYSTGRTLIAIDWEEMGMAPSGFDEVYWFTVNMTAG